MAREVTSRGAAFYGVTSGTRLTPEIVAAARERSGGKRAPKGSTVQTSVARATAAPRARTAAPEAVVNLSARPASAATTAPPKTTTPTIYGGREIVIDSLRWQVPLDALVQLFPEGGGAHVLTVGGSYHCLIRQRGAVREVVLSTAMQAMTAQKVRDRYFPTTSQ
jgi:hypothetical protein